MGKTCSRWDIAREWGVCMSCQLIWHGKRHKFSEFNANVVLHFFSSLGLCIMFHIIEPVSLLYIFCFCIEWLVGGHFEIAFLCIFLLLFFFLFCFDCRSHSFKLWELFFNRSLFYFFFFGGYMSNSCITTSDKIACSFCPFLIQSTSMQNKVNDR